MKKQEDRPKWREPPSQRPTKILSPHGQAQTEISAKTAQCETDPIEKLPSILPSPGEHLKKQLSSQTKLRAGHLSHRPLYHCQL